MEYNTSCIYIKGLTDQLKAFCQYSDSNYMRLEIKDSIDILNEVIAQLMRLNRKVLIEIDFKITNDKKWKNFTAVFPNLPDFIHCHIYGTSEMEHLRCLCFSGGRYEIVNVICYSIFAVGNTRLHIEQMEHYAPNIYAGGNARITIPSMLRIGRIHAKNNCFINCRTNAMIYASDNSTIIATDCNSIVEDNAKINALHGKVTVKSDKVVIISQNAEVYVSRLVKSVNMQAIQSTIDLHSECNINKIIKDNFTQFIFYDCYYENNCDNAYIDPRTYLNHNRIYYKCVHKSEDGIYHSLYDSDFTYSIGDIITPDHFDSKLEAQCARGIHIATLEWALGHYYFYSDNIAVLEIEVPEDAEIVVPYASTGKLRASKVKVLREVPVEEYGLLGEIYHKFKG